ncbi:MAG: tetratricopeptide (TPR) repeat protein [Flavobacteriaceae bacterium]|jgi:tetratricopeptide (TPR) repeat protein
MKSILTVTALIFLAISKNVSAQLSEPEVRELVANSSESQLIMQTSNLTQEGYLYYAEIACDRLLEINPESSNYNYRKGFLILDIRKDYVGAIPYLEKAILDIDKNYDMYSHKETSAAVDAIYHLAQCYHLNEDIGKALENYQLFIASSDKNSELIPVAELRIQQCQEAIKQMNSPVNVYLTNMGDKVNTDMPEYSPVISLDGSALYFTSRRAWANDETDEYRDPRINQFPEDVYVSYLDFDSTWTTPERLDFCKPRQNEATIAISSDERKIYLYQDSTGNGDIYFTDFYHAKFRDIEKLEMDNINTKYWETHAMMSHRKDLFFFVSDRPGGLGGRDIYMVRLKENGKWSAPINLGPNVNGPNDDDAPFIAVDNRTLYFATNDFRSIGGFDIMRTELQDDGTWSKAVNLGYPFNSTNDDIFYTTTLDGRKGYMTSFRKDGKGEKDIYEIHNDYLGMKDIAVLKGLIKTVDDKPIPEDFAINVKLVCIDCEEAGIDRFIFPRLRDGVFMTGLDPCRTYKLLYTNLSDNETLGDDTFTTLCDTNYQEIYRELLLDVDTRKLIFPPDTVVELPPVVVGNYDNLEFMHYFAYNKNKLTTKKGELKDFVKSVAAQLKEGREKITINVYSSASYVPTKTYGTNQRLSEIRAENMKYDIISYFEKDPAYAGKVNVVIVTKLVQGPEYDKDAVNKEKYFPYQYVGLKTE